jgi:hypothetical protein
MISLHIDPSLLFGLVYSLATVFAFVTALYIVKLSSTNSTVLVSRLV